MRRYLLTSVLFLIALQNPLSAQTALPIAADVDWPTFRDKTRKLVEGLEALKAPLPAESLGKLKELLENEPAKPQAAAEAVQKLLDAHCLIGVSINPESRVKAARGPAAVELRLKHESIFLVKVVNEAGVTQKLSVSGSQLTTAEKATEDRWLNAILVEDSPFSRKLSGQRVDYLVLRLTPLEAGKREATLKFDVGQGTQDLGFRGEVPILCNVK
jgi:hypothetical protein